MRARCVEAVEGLHRTIEGWLTGRSPRTLDAFAEFADAHAADFTMITPDGVLVPRDELFVGFEAAHGSSPGLAIRIEGVDVVSVDERSAVATYEEWQDGPGGHTGRRSTVLFDIDGAELRSRHLHETWISGG